MTPENKQVAAIPWRWTPPSLLEILLIRKRPDGDWGIPKGSIVDHGNDYLEAARIECLEEAGIDGVLNSFAIGEFSYVKRGRKCNVKVFLIKVTNLRERYRELNQRERKWFPLEHAMHLIAREPLQWMLAELPAWISENSVE